MKKSYKEKYELNLQDLMELVPVSEIAKQVDVLKDEDENKVIGHNTRWVVGDYVVYSGIRDVYSIGPSDTEIFKFILTPVDYRKFIVACEARRKELYGKKQNTK